MGGRGGGQLSGSAAGRGLQTLHTTLQMPRLAKPISLHAAPLNDVRAAATTSRVRSGLSSSPSKRHHPRRRSLTPYISGECK
jgi:hypothetical protein